MCSHTQEHTCKLYSPISIEKNKISILESERVNSQKNTFQSKTTKYQQSILVDWSSSSSEIICQNSKAEWDSSMRGGYFGETVGK